MEEKILEYILLSRKDKLDQLKKDIVDEVVSRISEMKQDKIQFTAKEICEIYNFSSSTLERYVRNGLKFKSSGKRAKRLFIKEEIENFLNKKRA